MRCVVCLRRTASSTMFTALKSSCRRRPDRAPFSSSGRFHEQAKSASVTVGNVVFANNAPLSLIAGPCQLESRQHAFDMAGALKELCAQARHRPRLQDQLRQGQPHLAVRHARRRPGRGAAGLRRSAQGIRPAGADRRAHRGAVRDRRAACRHPADPGLPVAARPTCWSPPPRPARSSTSRRASSWRPGT